MWIYNFSAGLCPKRNGRHVLRCWCRSQSLVHTWCTEGRADRKLLYKAALWTSYGILWNPAWVLGWLARNGHFRVGRFADFFAFPICGQTHLSATDNFSGFKTIIQKGDSLLTWHILKLQCDNYMIYHNIVCICVYWYVWKLDMDTCFVALYFSKGFPFLCLPSAASPGSPSDTRSCGAPRTWYWQHVRCLPSPNQPRP